MVRTPCSHCQEPRVRELGSYKATGSNPPPPTKKNISKLNFRAVNFFFKLLSEFKFKDVLSHWESSRGSCLGLGTGVGGSLHGQEVEEGG